MLGTIIFLLIVLSLYIYKRFEPYYDTMKHVKHRSGMTWFMLGLNLNNAVAKVEKFMKGYDTCFAGPFFMQVLRDPEDIKIVLNSDDAYEKTIFSSFFFRYGMLSDGGEVYKQQRKALSPLFSTPRLRFINPMINRTMSDFIEFFEKRRDSTKEVDFKHIGTYFGTTSSLYTIFNINITDYELLSRIIENIRLIILKSVIRFVRPWMYSHTFFEYTKIGKEVRKLKEEAFRLQTLDRLKPTEENNNNEDIDGLKFYHDYISKTDLDPKSLEFLESTLVFTGASYETTADVLANTLLLLAMNPDKQEILYNEIKSVLSSPDDNVTEEQIELMPYLGLVIKEGLRMLPAAVMIARKVENDIPLTRYIARAGSVVVMPLVEVHMDKKLWGEDAREFKPERFLDEDKIHPYQYFPFSKGPRICPGYKHSILTLKIFLSRFLLRYHVTTSLKFEELIIRFGMTLHIKQRPMIKIHLRSEMSESQEN